MSDLDKLLRWAGFAAHLMVLAQLAFGVERSEQIALFFILSHLILDRFYGELDWKIFNQ